MLAHMAAARMDDEAETEEERRYREQIASNIKTLVTLTGHGNRAGLARAVGWTESKLSRLVNGHKRWRIGDFAIVARELGVGENPYMLTRPWRELEQYRNPRILRAVAGDNAGYEATRNVEENRELMYSSASTSAVIIPFPQVNRPAREMGQLAQVRALHSHQLNEPNSPTETYAIRVKHA